MLYYSKVVETNYFYHRHHDLPFSLSIYMLFCPFVVAQHVSEELEENISPADIEAVEEWAYTVRVKVKGKRYRFFSKKKIQQQYSQLTETGETMVKLSPRVVLAVEADQRQYVAFAGYKDLNLAMCARNHIVNYGFAEYADIRPAKLTEGEWELVVPAFREDGVCSFAFRDLVKRSQEKAGVSP